MQRYYAEGRGQGEGADYRPWLQIHDLPSLGRVHRVWGNLTQRVHHFLSDGEWRKFLRAEADAETRDIREQFPLDRWRTFRIALRLGYEPPLTVDGTPYVMTTDFLITADVNGRRVLMPKAFKYESQLTKTRVKQLLHIEEVYWTELGLNWECTTDADFKRDLERNYDAVRGLFSLQGLREPYPNCFVDIRAALVTNIQTRTEQSLGALCAALDCQLNVLHGTSFDVARHLIAQRVLLVDLEWPRDISDMPVSSIRTAV